jgi:prepilin-type N-terminal cleavage/methylation domain-containing protein
MSTSLKSRQQAGFTLIELLVVIAIIGLLSSVILASLNQARAKGHDAAIKSEMSQMVTLYQEQYNDTGSYAPLWSGGNSVGWYGVATDCTSPVTPPTGTYASQQESLCAALINNESNCIIGAPYCLYLGTPKSPNNGVNHFSIMAWLPGAQQYYCMGSSGAASYDSEADSWVQPGCWGNP